jgi:hypothetical protein
LSGGPCPNDVPTTHGRVRHVMPRRGIRAVLGLHGQLPCGDTPGLCTSREDNGDDAQERESASGGWPEALNSLRGLLSEDGYDAGEELHVHGRSRRHGVADDQDPDLLLRLSANCAFPAASTAARQLDLASQGRPFVGDRRRADRTHPFWAMLPRPPYGTMKPPRPTGSAWAEAKGDTSWLGPRRRRWTSFAG